MFKMLKERRNKKKRKDEVVKESYQVRLVSENSPLCVFEPDLPTSMLDYVDNQIQIADERRESTNSDEFNAGCRDHEIDTQFVIYMKSLEIKRLKDMRIAQLRLISIKRDIEECKKNIDRLRAFQNELEI